MTRSLLLICSVLLPIFVNAQSYSIYALKFGERKNKAAMRVVAVGDTSSDSTKVFFMYWLLKGTNGKNILVDAGFTEVPEQDANDVTFTSPEKLLEAVNVKPEEITDIIITHPHWDHIGGIDLYPKAMVWIQEEDYDDLVNKQALLDFNKKNVQKVKERKKNGTLTLLKPLHDHVILPNVTVLIARSQHTPGSQYVMAHNGKQNVILASDNCKYYRNIEKLLSSPATTDQKAYVRNLRSMKQYMNGDADLVIPGHDPLVFTKFKTIAKDVAEIKK